MKLFSLDFGSINVVNYKIENILIKLYHFIKKNRRFFPPLYRRPGGGERKEKSEKKSEEAETGVRIEKILQYSNFLPMHCTSIQIEQ